MNALLGNQANINAKTQLISHNRKPSYSVIYIQRLPDRMCHYVTSLNGNFQYYQD
jgi:hypothetical protein